MLFSQSARHEKERKREKEREIARKRETKVCCPERAAKCHQVMKQTNPTKRVNAKPADQNQTKTSHKAELTLIYNF